MLYLRKNFGQCRNSTLHLQRKCEYDEETLEYWVNTRTEGILSREDLEEMSQTKQYEGDGGDQLNFKPQITIGDGFNFDARDPLLALKGETREGDHHKSVTCRI